MEDNKIEEIQLLEQSLNNLLLQKQMFQMELEEVEAALEEIKKSGDEVYKVIGQLMIKSDKSKAQEELENKKRIIEIRLRSIEKQEEETTKKIESLRKEILE